MAIDYLREAGVMVAHVQRALLDGTRDIEVVPAGLRRIARDEMWRERTDPLSGRYYGPFTSFAHFAATEAADGGLGTDTAALRKLADQLITLADELDKNS